MERNPLKHYFLLTITLAGIGIISCNDNSRNKEQKAVEIAAPENNVPSLIQYRIVKEYPHDATCYTEGLQYVDGYLYESGGQYGKSDLRKTDLSTGKILQQKKLAAQYFGEGMTVLNDKIYQLTYHERTCFVYDKNSMKQTGTFSYRNDEGWGLTNDGTNLIMSDGTENIYFINPADFKELKHITVSDQYGSVGRINELEYINGFIYANQWQTDLILKINPETGKVVSQANLADLRRQTGIPEMTNDESAPEVLNGIAYDKAGNRIFITGKNWPKLFEIKLDN